MEPKTNMNFEEVLRRIDDYEEFKKKVTETFYKDYSIFDERKSLIRKHTHFESLVNAVEEANKKLEGKTLSLCTREQLEAFFKELLRQVGKKISFSKCLFETNLSIRQERVLKTNGKENVLIIISDFPRKYDHSGLVEDTGISAASLKELFESMNISFSESKGDLFGILFTIDYAYIVWIENYEPQHGLRPSQISVFQIFWYSISLQSFIEDITEKEPKATPLARIQNIERLYVFLDFISSILVQQETKEYVEKLVNKSEEELDGLMGKMKSEEAHESIDDTRTMGQVLSDDSDDEYPIDHKARLQEEIEIQKRTKVCIDEFWQIYK